MMEQRGKSNLRKSFPYLIMLAIVIPLGLATRKYPTYFPSFIAEYGGDTLWALTAYLLTRSVLPRKKIWLVALISGLFCLFIELTQLCEAAWLNQLRDTTIGGLVLGRGWLWSDLICYLTGIVMGLFLDFFLRRMRKPAGS